MNITVTRSGVTSGPASVNYATGNGTAKEGRDYVVAYGVINFAAAETSKAFSVLIIDNAFVDSARTVNLTLTNPNGATLGNQSTAVLTINDNDPTMGLSPLDVPRSFVQYDYYDFLGRYPDLSGWDFWTNQITNCGTNSQCVEVARINVSASFFLSIEFQQTGYLVERFYKVAYGSAAGTSILGGNHQVAVPIIRFDEFLRDSQRIGRGVVVLSTGWEQLLESNKQAYALEFVQSSRFLNGFPVTMTPSEFVTKMYQNAGLGAFGTEFTAVVAEFHGAANTSDNSIRAKVFRLIAEKDALVISERNLAFVLAEYFGYLRRNPNDAPDSDYTGYDFWLTKLNQFNGNYIQAEMVKAFLSSIEYRQRFGPVASSQPINGAIFVTQSAPASVLVGESFNALVTMRNVGNTMWTPTTAHRLGTQAPQDNDVWGMNRGLLTTSVAPNSEVTFSLPLTAPATPGAYSFKWRMVQDAVEWFGDFTPTLTVNVNAPASGNIAAFVSQSVPGVMPAGTTNTVSVTMKNTGTTTWTAANAYRLGSQAPQDNDLWGRNRVLLSKNVLPGEEVTFTFSITAPQTPGTYNFRWQMVRDGVEWFGGNTPNLLITVQ